MTAEEFEGIRGRAPLFKSIYEHFRGRIDAGNYVPGSRLPTVRDVARRVGTTAETVAAAYRMLSDEGLVRSQPGVGTVVLAQRGGPPALGPAGGDPRLPIVAPLATPSYHETYRRLLQLDRAPQCAGFASYVVPPELFPAATGRLLRALLRRDGSALFEMGPPEGELELRRAVSRLVEPEGSARDERNVVITNGGQEGLSLIFRALVAPGETVLIESPTYLGALDALSSIGARILGVPMRPDGPDLDALDTLASGTRPKLFYTMPSYQNPTGFTMSAGNRERLLWLARRHTVLLVEDGSAAGLGYDEPAPPSLLAHDREGLVVHVGTFSKTLFSGIRVGYVVAPRGLVEPVLRLKYLSNVHASVLLQRLVHALLAGQRFARHLRRVRGEYRSRRAAMLDALNRALRGRATWTVPGGGFSIWVSLPAEVDAADLFRLAIDRGVSFVPGAVFFPSDIRHHTFRLCFSATAPAVIARGIAVLGEALTELLAAREPRTLAVL